MDKQEFRCNCVEMSRAIKNEIDAKYLTLDALFEHLYIAQSKKTRLKKQEDKSKPSPFPHTSGFPRF